MRTVDLVPAQGSTQDLLARLRAYVGQTDPDWAGKLAPASDPDLDRLSELAGLNALGLSLPENYRVWALAAGAADGGLLSGTLCAWVTVEEMVEHYLELHRFEPDLVEGLLPVVMVKKVGDEYSLDLRERADEPSIHETSGGEDIGFFSANWETLLFQCAIEMRETRRCEHARYYGASAADLRSALAKSGCPDASALIGDFLREHGLLLPWTNDPRHVYGLGEDASIIVNLARGGGAPFIVVGQDRKRERELGEGLAELIGAEPVILDQWR
jgi:hypothetical protein